MNTTTCLRWLGFFLLFSTFAKLGHSAEIPTSTLQIMVEDKNGSIVPAAHVYIYSKDRKTFVDTKDSYGTADFSLPQGDYRIYAALTTDTHGVVDHYSSPEAKVHLADDSLSLILSLDKAENSELYLSETARKKMGIDDELAKYLN